MVNDTEFHLIGYYTFHSICCDTQCCLPTSYSRYQQGRLIIVLYALRPMIVKCTLNNENCKMLASKIKEDNRPAK